MVFERMVGIREKIKRAEKHIADFQAACISFRDTEPYTIRIEVDADPASPVSSFKG